MERALWKVLQVCELEYLLPLPDLLQFNTTCSRLQGSFPRLYAKWNHQFGLLTPLPSMQPGAGNLTAKRLLNEELVFRSFVRFICDKGVVAGGFGASIAMESEHGIKWNTHDLDIFVSTQRMYDVVADAYLRGVLPFIRKSNERPVVADEDYSDSTIRYQSPMSVEELKEALQSRLHLMRMRGPCFHGYNIVMETLEAVPASLPQQSLARASYRINRCQSFGEPADHVSHVLPVNIILVKFCGRLSRKASTAELVCNGFDMEQCAISVKTTPALHYKLCFHADACACIKKRTLRFRTSLRVSNADGLKKLWCRIVKYARRGFRLA